MPPSIVLLGDHYPNQLFGYKQLSAIADFSPSQGGPSWSAHETGTSIMRISLWSLLTVDFEAISACSS